MRGWSRLDPLLPPLSSPTQPARHKDGGEGDWRAESGVTRWGVSPGRVIGVEDGTCENTKSRLGGIFVVHSSSEDCKSGVGRQRVASPEVENGRGREVR